MYCLCPLLLFLNLNKNINLDNSNVNKEYREKIIIKENDFFQPWALISLKKKDKLNYLEQNIEMNFGKQK